MGFRTSWIDGNRYIVISLRFTPVLAWIGLERISVIVEIRDAKSRKIQEVWHLHIRYSDGKVVHRDRKYP